MLLLVWPGKEFFLVKWVVHTSGSKLSGLGPTRKEKPGSPGWMYWFEAGVMLGSSQDGSLGTTLGRPFQPATGPLLRCPIRVGQALRRGLPSLL